MNMTYWLINKMQHKPMEAFQLISVFLDQGAKNFNSQIYLRFLRQFLKYADSKP